LEFVFEFKENGEVFLSLSKFMLFFFLSYNEIWFLYKWIIILMLLICFLRNEI
jgi:hypothetical protein